MNVASSHVDRFRFPLLLWFVAVVGILSLNALTQPYEDELSLVPPVKAYYLDSIWYIDDIIGPSLFLVAGLMLIRQSGLKLSRWPVLGLGLACVAFCFGDTADLHWVVPSSMERENYGVSFSSWMSKVMVVITFCFFMIHAYDQFPRSAQKNMLFAFLLLYIDQIQMSISFDFAGYHFHVFEESLEVVTALILVLGVALVRIKPEAGPRDTVSV